jgi:hypothetical protein
MSLIERGLIPNTAKLRFEQLPLTTKKIQPNIINAQLRKENPVIKKGNNHKDKIQDKNYYCLKLREK